jgi:nucleoid-associated protein YgaU
MTTGNFTAAEWKQLVNAPRLIHHLLEAADRGAILTQRSEAKALEEYLKGYRSQSALVQEIIAGQKDSDQEIKAKAAETQAMLEQIGELLESKADNVEGDAVRDFLTGAGEAIAKAAKEQAWAGGKQVSAAEQKTLAAIATALKATDSDKRRRNAAAAAAEARKKADDSKAQREAEARKLEQDRKAAAEAKQKTAEEAQAAQEALKAKEVEAQKKAAAAQAQKEREARAQELTDEIARKREEKAQKEEEARKAQEAEAAAEAAAQAAAKLSGIVYVVKPGDTLSGIAQSMLGNANRWPEIFEANKDVISNPSLILPGWKLRIPK